MSNADMMAKFIGVPLPQAKAKTPLKRALDVIEKQLPVTKVTKPVTQVTQSTQPVTNVTHCSGCRCKRYATKAEKQKAYRDRKANG